MLLIVAHHYVVNSGITKEGSLLWDNPLSIDSQLLLIFGAWGKTGINCFVLITGYFMCKSEITAKKFSKLLFQVIFYNIAIRLVFIVSGYDKFTITTLIHMFVPVRNITTNFTGCYLVFFLLIPFLNALIQHLDERKHIYLLLLFGFMYVFIGTMPKFDVNMNYVSWFSVLFLIGSYIRLYPKPLWENTFFWGWSTLILFLLSIMSIPIMTWLGLKIVGYPMTFCLLSDSNHLFAVLLGVSSFLFFKDLKCKQNKFINAVASTTFGVLLIHANSDTMRQWLWRDTLHVSETYGQTYMMLHAVICVIIVFAVCSFIDWLRIQFIEKPFFKCWEKIWPPIQATYIQIESKVLDKF